VKRKSGKRPAGRRWLLLRSEGDDRKVLTYPTVAYVRDRMTGEEMLRQARLFLETVRQRRTVREFAPDPIPEGILEAAIEAASLAPSGANMQPWTFVVVRDPAAKREIRLAAEKEEYASYHGRMTEEWLRALAPLQTDWHKEFLEIAPALIVVFKQDYGIGPEGQHVTHYYVNESVGIACGFLLAALNAAGLATLTHTPSPMGFLRDLLERPRNEKAFLLIPVGYPAEGCRVPDIRKKSLTDVLVEK
jgi:iodotyrosine deiodinase